MTTFTGGPADKITLCLRRAPKLLRVVRDAAGNVDALDQLDDAPKLDEDLFAYRLVGKAGWVRVQMAGKGGRGRHCETYATGEYVLVDSQPDDATMRDTAAWQAWAQNQLDTAAPAE